jgi:hypothetical protein
MAKKLGTGEELQKGKQELNKETEKMRRLEIDQKAARMQIAGMINENRKRLEDFDEEDMEMVNEEDLDEN